jgi:hypothetical protein
VWLMTPARGFYSVVEHRDQPGNLLIRARVRGDLENLEPLIDGLQILDTPEGDYGYRATITRADWQAAVAVMASEVTYPNVKDAVVDDHRHDVYANAWLALRDLQGGGR